MVPFSLFLALKYLKPKRSVLSIVTFISILGVLLGVAILVIVLSVMTGFDNMWRDKILSFKPHITITGNYGIIENPEKLCRDVETIAGVKGAAPVIESLVLMQYDGRTAPPIILGTDPEKIKNVSRIPDFIRFGEFNIKENNAVIGYDLALRMGLDVGDTFLVYSPQNVMAKNEFYLPEELLVSGVFDMDMRDFDEGFILTSIDVAGNLIGLDSGASIVYVMIEDPFKFTEYAGKIERKIGPAYTVKTWKEIDSIMFSALRNEKTMMFVLLVFITIVAVFCVTNTLIVITVQKTNEIGLLKALGFSSRKIMAAFVWHGWIQCLTGIISGIGVGLLVLNNLKNIVRWLGLINIKVFPKEIYGFSEIPWQTSIEELLQIALFVMIFCTLSSIIPAYRAARLDPVEAFRQE